MTQKAHNSPESSQPGWLLGYARVSTTSQNLDVQLRALTETGVPAELVFTDKISCTQADRPGLAALMAEAREGDTLVLYSLDRLGRSLVNMVTTIEELIRRGVALRSLTATTSSHRPGPTHNVSAHVRLAVPTNEPAPLVTAARTALVPKLLHGMQYMRAGILCTDLAPEGSVPVLPGVLEQHAPIGELIDAVNRRFGTGTLALGRLGTHSPAPWANRQADLSPRYTTDWNELRTVS